MDNVQSDLLNFPWKRKPTRKFWGLKSPQNFLVAEYGVLYVIEYSLFTFPFGLLPSESGHSERRIWGKIPPGFFHNGENICTKVSQNMSWLLLETYWRSVFCQLQPNKLWKEVLNVTIIKHLFPYFCYVITWGFLIRHSYCYFWIPHVYFNTKKQF